MNETNTIQTGPVDKTAIRNAATVIVLRDRHDRPAILMGQRGAKAAFMPNKFVFPGGAVDPDDAGEKPPRPCVACEEFSRDPVDEVSVPLPERGQGLANVNDIHLVEIGIGKICQQLPL